MRLAILVPTHEHLPALFAYDLAQLQAATLAAYPPGTVEIGLYFEVGTYVHQARESLLRQAVADGAQYVLFLDSDMRFPAESFLHLMEHGEAVVGANYAQRGIPTDFVAIKSVEDREKLVTDSDSSGLEAVDATGLGVCLIETAALGRIPEGEPWFFFEQMEDGHQMGEDVYFFRLMREAGIQPYVDHDLSRAVGHIGQFTYRTHHAALERNG